VSAKAAALAVLLPLAGAAHAHQLDSYVQAATVAVARDRVGLELRLTPGAEVLAPVLRTMDLDADGMLSGSEQRSYAERVLRDLALRVDGTRVPLRLVRWDFPPLELMREGMGDIWIECEGRLPAGGPQRTLTFQNRHQRRIAAYLANASVPDDPAIRITAQDRSADQSAYTMNYVLQ
jgi:hypothetical protein